MSTVTRFRQLMERRIPDPLTFAVWLTLCMIGLALVLTPVSPEDLLLQWGDGLSALLAFTMHQHHVGGLDLLDQGHDAFCVGVRRE